MKISQTFNRKILTLSISGILASSAPLCLIAAPQNGQVSAGQGTISTPDANTTQIQQNSHNLVLDWSSFNVSAQEQVNFIQPSSSAAALNNIHDQNPSQILGAINANGRVFLSNPNGLVFGPYSTVNVNSLIASGLNIDSSAFMSGQYSLQALQNAGSVINYGLINAATGGNVALLGGHVANHGQIIANYGRVALASGSQMVLDFDGDGLMSFQVNEQLLSNSENHENGIHNTGSISADAGQIVLEGQAAADVFTNVVNNEGLLQATSIVNEGGVIRLQSSSRTLHSGDIDVASSHGQGGEVQILGNQVGLSGSASVDASGASGGGVVLIGGDYKGLGEIQTAEATFVGDQVNVNANAIQQGDGGKIIVWSDQTTRSYGSLQAKGGQQQGNGGFIETSGGYLELGNHIPDASAHQGLSGHWLIDPVDITIQAGGGDIPSTGSGDPGPVVFAPTDGAQTTIQVSLIETALNNGSNVTINTAGAGTSPGDITVSATITKSQDNGSGDGSVLTLNADNDINIDQAISSSVGTLGINLNAENNINLNAGLTSNAGDIAVNAGNDINIVNTSTLSSAGGLITLFADDSALDTVNPGRGTLTINGSVQTGSGSGDINLQGFGFDSGVNAVINAGTGSVSITTSRVTDNLQIGGGGSFLEENELDNITADTLNLGSATHAGGITVGGNITINPINFENLVLQSNEVTISNTLDIGTRNLSILPNPGRNISIGDDGNAEVAPDLDITVAEFGRITANTITIGDASSGSITLFEAINPASINNISLTTSGAVIDANATGVDITTGTLTIRSATGIGSGDALETSLISLDAVNTTSGNINITEADNLTVAALQQAAGASAAGTVTLVSNTGTIALDNGSVLSQGGLITLTATTGAIIDAAGGSGVDITNTAGQATLTAASGIGNGDALETTLTTLSATNSTSGDIDITETDAVSVSASNSGGGAVNLSAADLTVNATNVTANTGAVTLSADEMILTGTVTGNAGVTVRPSGVGTVITLGTGTDGLNLTSLDLDQIFSAGTLQIGANTGNTVGSITVDAALNASNANSLSLVTNDAILNAAGSLTSTTLTLSAETGITASTTTDILSATNSTSGNIDITESDGLTVTALQQAVGASATGTVTLVSDTGTIALDNGSVLSQGGLITLTATSGAITDAAGGAGADITNTTGQATLNAATGIGSGDALETSLISLDAVNTTSGNINITEADNLTVAALQQAAGASAAGTVTLVSNTGTIALDNGSVLSQGGLITLTATTGAIIDAAGGSGVDITNTAGQATLTAASGIGNGDALETTLTTLSATNSTSGDIDITETDAVSVSASNSGGGAVNLSAADLTVNATNVTANTGAVTLSADEMILTGTVTGNAGVTVRPSGVGTVITLGTGTDGLNLTSLDLDQIFSAGTLQIGANTGNTVGSITVDAALNASNANSLSLVTNDAILNAAGSLTSTTLTLSAETGITASTTTDILSATNSTSGNIDITESDGLTVTALQQAVGASATGTVTLVSDTGTIALDNGSVLSQGGLITLTATSGAITDAAGGAGADITNTTGQATLNAATGIGSGDALETSLASLDAVNTTTGNINITEADNLTVAALQQSAGASAAGSVTLESNTGTIALDNGSVLSQGGLITLTATAGAISDAAGGSGVDITNTGGEAILTAFSGIGNGDALETTVTTLSATNSTSGDIDIAETDAVSVSASNSGGGAVNLSAADLTVNATNVTANTGAVTLSADEMILTGTVTGNAGVTVRPSGVGTVITLGTGTDGLNLTSLDLDQIFSAGTLQIGANTGNTVGSITVDAALNALNANSLSLVTNGAILDSAGSLTATTLTLSAETGITATTTTDTLSATNSTSGNIDITETDGLTVHALQQLVNASTTGTVTLLSNTGNIALDNGSVVSQGGLITLTATTGAITDAAGGAGADITNTTGQATLNAATGIGSGDALETSLASLDAVNATSNAIQIDNSGAFSINRVLQSTAGDILLSASDTLTVDSAGTPVNAISTASGLVSLSATGVNADIVVNDGIAATGTVTLSADNDVSLAAEGDISAVGVTLTANNNNLAGDGGNVISMANGALINAGTGAIVLDASGATGGTVTLGQLTTSNTVNVTSQADIVDGNGASSNVTGSTFTAQAQTGIGDGDALETAATFINIFNATSGGSFLNNSSATGVTISSNPANVGEINFTEVTGGITLGGVLQGDTINITSATTINDDPALITPTTLSANSVTLSAASGIGNTVTPLLTSAPILTFTNVNNDVHISAPITNWTVSGNAGSGTINLTNSGGNLSLNSLVTTTGINLSALNGAINDANDAAVNLTANTVILESNSGIGSSDAIETNTSNLAFTNNSSGAVQIVNSSTPSLSLQQSSNAGAAISVTQSVAGGSLLINGTLESTGGGTPGAAISLISDNMDLTLPVNPADPPVGRIDAGTGAVNLITFSNNQPISIGGLSTTYTEAVINNITTSGGLTIGAVDYAGEIVINSNVDTSTTITGGTVSLLSDTNISIGDGGGLTNAVATSLTSASGNILINGDLTSNLGSLALGSTIGNILIGGILTSDLNLNLQASQGNIFFRDGLELNSTQGIITLTSSGPIAGTGSGTFTAAGGLQSNAEIIMGGNTVIDIDTLEIGQNITTTSGNLDITSAALSTSPGITLSAADTLILRNVLTALGDLSLIGRDGVNLVDAININGNRDLSINAGTGTLDIAGAMTATGNVALTASELQIGDALTITGTLTVSDQAGGNGIALATSFDNTKLNFGIGEYNSITAAGIVLQSSNSITLGSDFSSTTVVPLTINTSSLVTTGSSKISLASDLDFSSSAVDIAGGLDIDVLGSFAMAGSIQTDSPVTINSATGIDMGAASTIATTNDPITFVTDTSDINLGFLNAGGSNVSLTATTGSILNGQGAVLDVTGSDINIQAANANLSAQDRIGASSTDAITLNVDGNGIITLSFGADTAFVNNLQNATIINNGGGTVAVGLVFSDQILGIGHNLGLSATQESAQESDSASTDAQQSSDISILGMDFLALLANDEEEDFISSIIPSVPVLIRTLDGWRFEAPSRQQILKQSRQRSKDGYKYIDWF